MKVVRLVVIRGIWIAFLVQNRWYIIVDNV